MTGETGEGDASGLWWLAALGLAGIVLLGVLNDIVAGFNTYLDFITGHPFLTALLGDGSELGRTVLQVNVNTIIAFVLSLGFWNYLYYLAFIKDDAPVINDYPPYPFKKFRRWLVSNILAVGIFTLLVFCASLFYFTSIKYAIPPSTHDLWEILG